MRASLLSLRPFFPSSHLLTPSSSYLSYPLSFPLHFLRPPSSYSLPYVSSRPPPIPPLPSLLLSPYLTPSSTVSPPFLILLLLLHPSFPSSFCFRSPFFFVCLPVKSIIVCCPELTFSVLFCAAGSIGVCKGDEIPGNDECVCA